MQQTTGLAGLLNQFQSSLTDILRQLETATLGGEAYDYISFRLQQLSRHLLRIIQLHYPTSQHLEEEVTRCVSLLSNVCSDQQLPSLHTAPVEACGVGRPQIFTVI